MTTKLVLPLVYIQWSMEKRFAIKLHFLRKLYWTEEVDINLFTNSKHACRCIDEQIGKMQNCIFPRHFIEASWFQRWGFGDFSWLNWNWSLLFGSNWKIISRFWLKLAGETWPLVIGSSNFLRVIYHKYLVWIATGTITQISIIHSLWINRLSLQ